MDSDHVVFMKKICVSGHIEVKSMFKGQLYFENMYHVDWVLSCILQLGKFIVSRVSVSCKQGFEGGTVLCCRGCLLHCRMFSSILGFYPLDANTPTHPQL